MPGGVGLRERKKAATRAALSAAANRLAIEVGVSHVTVDAIAAEADVSPRTFHNYFSSREEAIVASIVDFGNTLIDELRRQPADTPIWDALRAVIIDAVKVSAGTREQVHAQMRMMIDNPGVLASQLAALDRLRLQFAEVVADRTGTNIDRDLYPHLVAGAAANILKVAFELWGKGHDGDDIIAVIDSGFDQTRAGLPQPGRE